MRSNSLLCIFAALLYSQLVPLVHRSGWRNAVSYCVVVAVAAHVHYDALVMLLEQVVAAATVLLARRARWRDWWWLMLGVAIVALPVLPWMASLRRVAAMDE